MSRPLAVEAAAMVRRAERTFARKINILQFACGGSPL